MTRRSLRSARGQAALMLLAVVGSLLLGTLCCWRSGMRSARRGAISGLRISLRKYLQVG
jgi:hypothetical protein